ncbi:alpha/beta fold hydrolase [Streptomyces camelliae]|uniref:Alpha/beta hydrolase n=1 Tax=Streptomyces camelliae TaxID=3004093 RepID=A0ABY7PJL1_9ACTN|nr:alpha/beta hydrolase [Streptomyces sp. HUAS 2-6]WBO68763.1 alpha/beta hydrolase [Streptomyces sp. HUAS 2-6]
MLVGHSMGAAEVVRSLTRRGDERVKGVVLSAPTTPFLLRTDENPEGPVQAATAEAARAVMCRDIGAFVEGTSGAEWFGPGHPVSAGLSDWTRRQFFDTPLQVLLSTNETCIEADLREELTAITVPALVIQGDADRSAPIEYTGYRTHGLLPDSRLVVIDGAGHGLCMSDPDRYNKEILAFANTLPMRASRADGHSASVSGF